MATRSGEPRDLSKAFNIIILGAIGITQSNIVDIIHCGKQTVVRCQKWFRELSYQRARSLVPDDRIRHFVEEDFIKMVHPDRNEMVMVRESKLTCDSVLLHYGHLAPPVGKPDPPQGPGSAPQSLYAGLLKRHWDRLRGLTETFRDQLVAPTPETLFTADVCRRVHTSVRGKTPLIPPARWGELFEAPFMTRQSSENEPRYLMKLLVEREDLFPQLTKHLESEDSPLFPVAFPAWITRYQSIVSESLKIIEKLTSECPRVTQAVYARVDYPNGLFWELPAYIGRYALAQSAGKPLPGIATLPHYDGREPFQLVPLGSSCPTLARDADPERIKRYQAALTELARRIIKEDAIILGSLNKSFAEIARLSTELRAALAAVIERGDYRGSCNVCQNFLEILSPAPDRQTR